MATWTIRVHMKDGEDKPTFTQFYIDGARTPAQVQTDLDAILPEIDNITMCKITGVSASYSFALPSVSTGAPDPQANREYKGRWTFATALGFKSEVTIPGFNITYVLDNTHLIDRTNSDISDFEDAFFAASTTDNRAASLTTVDSAQEDFT